MIAIFRWTVRLTVVALCLAGVALGGALYFATRSLPDYNRTVTVAGLSAPVEVVRNTHNVPHIFGAADADVFFGLGFAHAQDRLWQMTLMRRTAQGRLSELFGARTVKTDDLMRRLDLYTLASQSVAALDPETLAMLEAYAAGVNARIAQVNAEALGRGAPEFFLFSPEIAPWRPADSIAVVKLMALQLAGHAREEVLRLQAGLVLSPARLADLHPDAPGRGVAALPEVAQLFPGLKPRQWAQVDPGFLSPLAPRGLEGASNVWAAAPKRTAAGATLLANDPHLPLTAPGIWYLARLELQSGPVIGGTIPGMPVILAGRSERIAWGLTTAGADDQDITFEEVNPNDPTQYRTPDGWAEFQTRRSILEVADAEPITLTLRWSEAGPVLTPGQLNLGAVTPPGHVAALRWTALNARDTSLRAGLELMRAPTLEAALEAGRHFVAPAQNLVVVDRTRIAQQLIGHLPARDPGHETQGRLPSYGWRVENRWQGVQPYADNPRFIDPVGGILGNTNNKMIERPFPNHVSFDWIDTQRVLRWQRLMQGRAVHTRDSFIEAQLDTVSPTAQALLPLIGRDLWFQEETAPAGTPARRRQEALDLLGAWNGEMSEHLPEPLIYAAWLRALQDRLIRDDLGPLADRYTHVEPLFIERVFRDVEGASAWCDVVQSSAVETCAEAARLALEDALVWLEERYGTGITALRWGDAHQAQQDHPVLGGTGLGFLVNIRQSTSGGDNTLMRGKTSGTEPAPFANVHAAGYRGVYTFADPESAVFITSTGQSGHPLSRHYDDLGELWRRGEYIPMTLDPALARAGAVGITVLQPQ